MKDLCKTLNFGILVLGLAAFLGVLAVERTSAQNPIKEIEDRMDGNYKTLTALKSDVAMSKVNSQTGTRDNTQGTCNYLPKTAKHVMYVRIDWTKPIDESLLVIGDDYKLYRPSINTVYIGKTNGAKANGAAGGALTFVSMSKEQLNANYTVKYVGLEGISGGIQTWHLQLTPKTKTSYKTADLWVDTDGMPRQATVTEKNDDTTTVLLSNIQKNVDIKPTVFKLDTKNAQVVKS